MTNKRALIVDDNVGNSKVLIGLLHLESVESVHIADPLKLESVLEEQDQYDVIFLDLEMPNLDGFEVLHMLHTYPQLSTVPVVACTVHTSEINTAREIGFHSFLGKPINAEAFPQQLANILNGQRVWAPAR